MFKQRKFRTARLVQATLSLAIASGLANTAQAETLGMVTSADGNNVTVFDADTDTIKGSIPIPSALTVDCAISADQNLGLVGNFWGKSIFVVSPKALTLTAGINPIPLSTYVEDIALSADQHFVLATDGGGAYGLSVADVNARTEVTSYLPGTAFQAVEACSDNSVLTSSASNSIVQRFSIGPTGLIVDPGESLAEYGAFNTACAVASGAGLVAGAGDVESVLYPPLTRTGLDARNTGDGVNTVLVSPSGTSAFVRTTTGSIQAFTFDQLTGALGASPYLSWPTAFAAQYYGADQMAIHPNGSKLYVSEGNALNVYDTSTGALITSMTDAGLSSATGVCLPGTDPHPANLRMSFAGPSTQFRSGAVVPVYARVDNYGPNIAGNPGLDLAVDAPQASVSISAAAGWTCQARGTSAASFHCSADASTMALSSAIFALRITAPAAPPSGFLTVLGKASSRNVDRVRTNNDASFKVYVRPAPAAKPYTSPVN